MKHPSPSIRRPLGLAATARRRRGPWSAIACVVTVASLLAACDRRPVTAPSARPVGEKALSNAALSPSVRRDLARLRALTAPFHDMEKAEQAGWSVRLTDCLANPPEGAMGYHYANPAFIDATAAVLQPELLMYEPEANGRLRLVGIEYIVPYALVPASSSPPRLFGHEFHHNDAFQVWGLHAWVWRHNPSGMFSDWNPNVTCANAG